MAGSPGQFDSPFDPTAADLSAGDFGDLPLVPLFPLPNVVLFPRAVLPLHIFEERYKAMTRHALEGDRQIAMALLLPGWEKSYYGKPPIDPVVCVGSILSHERLPDGNYNFLLQGALRARVVAEAGNEPYRLARLRALVEVPATVEELKPYRQRLLDLFTHPSFAATGMGWQFAKLLASPLPTADLADLAAYNFLDDVALKQSLLGEENVSRRVRRTVEALEQNTSEHNTSLAESATPVVAVTPSSPAGSLRRFSNPSLN